MAKPSVVKESKRLKKLLAERISDERGLSHTAVSNDAREHGRNISVESLSRYFKHDNPKGGLSEVNILWLCFRYGIHVSLKVVKQPWDEEKNFDILKKIFG